MESAMEESGSRAPERSSIPRALVVGEAGYPDFVSALALVSTTAELEFAADVQQACAMLAREQADAEAAPPAVLRWIILAQPRPGMFTERDAERLREAAPSAEQIALAGSWCEGEPRTGAPLVGVRRLYWYEFTPWWLRELQRLGSAGANPSAAAPSVRPAAGLIVVCTPIRETAETLMDELGRDGLSTLWTPEGSQPVRFAGALCGVWVGGQLEPHEEPGLAAFCKRLQRDGSPVVALLDFPRRERCELAMCLGAAAVLPKPWLHDDLLGTILSLQDAAAASETAALGMAA